jgi:hypothetical protein
VLAANPKIQHIFFKILFFEQHLFIFDAGIKKYVSTFLILLLYVCYGLLREGYTIVIKQTTESIHIAFSTGKAFL